jgi:uncharacterized protein (UPF0254 family)
MKKREELEALADLDLYSAYMLGYDDRKDDLRDTITKKVTDKSAETTKMRKVLNFFSMMRRLIISTMFIWTGIHAAILLNIDREELGIIRKKKIEKFKSERSLRKAKKKSEKLREKARRYRIEADNIEMRCGSDIKKRI